MAASVLPSESNAILALSEVSLSYLITAETPERSKSWPSKYTVLDGPVKATLSICFSLTVTVNVSDFPSMVTVTS